MLGEPTTRRRLIWERAIWFIDLTAYLFLGVAGAIALFSSTDYVVEIVGSSAAIFVWALLLLCGGLGSFIGRLTRFWAVEYVSNVLVQWGALIYAVILIPAGVWDGRGVLLAFVLCSFLSTLRRYAELKILTNEPGLDTFRRRLDAALKRRTENAVAREHY